MARAIDADKAIEVAQIKYNDWNLAMAAADGRREINLCFKKQELFKAVKAVLDCVPTLTPLNEWVSVEDRLPTDERPVLVFVGYADTMTGFITTSSYFCFDPNPHWQWDGLVRDEQRTLFWMPLPTPPGKDNNVPTKAPNEPLTLERLREMDGEPVWVVYDQDAAKTTPGFDPLALWALVEVTKGSVFLTNNLGGRTAYADDQDLEWAGITVYRRPPEGEEDT